ncbi:hypothetical protein DFP73DRAFT_317309 [Morchella snyderi]|nr:hypothetical protein DFP73DRAFT_317309 [Morchella snyderi]
MSTSQILAVVLIGALLQRSGCQGTEEGIPPKLEKLAMHTRSNLLQTDTSKVDRYLSANRFRDNPWAEIANFSSFGVISKRPFTFVGLKLCRYPQASYATSISLCVASSRRCCHYHYHLISTALLLLSILYSNAHNVEYLASKSILKQSKDTSFSLKKRTRRRRSREIDTCTPLPPGRRKEAKNKAKKMG